jgi:hypothetical protein
MFRNVHSAVQVLNIYSYYSSFIYIALQVISKTCQIQIRKPQLPTVTSCECNVSKTQRCGAPAVV